MLPGGGCLRCCCHSRRRRRGACFCCFGRRDARSVSFMLRPPSFRFPFPASERWKFADRSEEEEEGQKGLCVTCAERETQQRHKTTYCELYTALFCTIWPRLLPHITHTHTDRCPWLFPPPPNCFCFCVTTLRSDRNQPTKRCHMCYKREQISPLSLRPFPPPSLYARSS